MNIRHRLEKIKDRYFRSVIAAPKGIITHHGDCTIYRSQKVYGSSPCNCGLLHDLEPLRSGITLKLYPPYFDDLYTSEGCTKPSKEDTDKINQLMKEVFDYNPNHVEEDITIDDLKAIREVFGEDY